MNTQGNKHILTLFNRTLFKQIQGKQKQLYQLGHIEHLRLFRTVSETSKKQTEQ